MDSSREPFCLDISEDPERFYMDIHSRRYPGGAARGQLELAQ
ncbi:MAG: CHRD domain-containing protein [Actinomycetota bacterium]